MDTNRVLWLEDQYKDFGAFISALFRAGFPVDPVRSVSEAVEKLRETDYTAVIFDIKVLPGDSPEWIELDKMIREKAPRYDSSLGLELLRSIFEPEKASVKLSPPIEIDPKKVIVFSIVYDKVDELSSFGIPADQILYKADSTLNTLPELIKKILARKD